MTPLQLQAHPMDREDEVIEGSSLRLYALFVGYSVEVFFSQLTKYTRSQDAPLRTASATIRMSEKMA